MLLAPTWYKYLALDNAIIQLRFLRYQKDLNLKRNYKKKIIF